MVIMSYTHRNIVCAVALIFSISMGPFSHAYNAYGKGTAVKAKESRNSRTYYRVRKGDTLFRIARKFRCSVDEISAINGLNNKNCIFIGKKIKIPQHQWRGSAAAGDREKNNPYRENNKGHSPAFIWPLRKVHGYEREHVNGVKPIGIIITGGSGSAVISAAAGTVKRVGRMRGFGRYVVIEHSARFLTVYSRLDDITVSAGERVGKGMKIGSLDSRELHCQIDLGGKPVKPLNYLPGRS